ncbi:MAG: DNA-binding protein [Sphingomonas sp.]|uniref:helix-turn-helix transcriptional regulator n=1 Tax=Sphingomonas sp. TaxID=28214 RepID=UPI0035621B4A
MRERPLTASPPPVLRHYLPTPDAAIVLGLSARTLEKHRCYGTGPVYHKLGGRVVYTLEELQSWADSGARRSTHDPDAGVIHPARKLNTGHINPPGPVRR